MNSNREVKHFRYCAPIAEILAIVTFNDGKVTSSQFSRAAVHQGEKFYATYIQIRVTRDVNIRVATRDLSGAVHET